MQLFRANTRLVPLRNQSAYIAVLIVRVQKLNIHNAVVSAHASTYPCAWTFKYSVLRSAETYMQVELC